MRKSLPIIIIIITLTSLVFAVFYFKTKTGKLILREPTEYTKTVDIGNKLEKANLIRLTTPNPNTVIKSPLLIKGEARGNWFFEASFPIELQDANGVKIAEWYATADGEWMTEEFVPFSSTLNFETPIGMKSGTLILRKDNASGLPEFDDALIIPVLFE
jgi:hypothetical protein